MVEALIQGFFLDSIVHKVSASFAFFLFLYQPGKEVNSKIELLYSVMLFLFSMRKKWSTLNKVKGGG